MEFVLYPYRVRLSSTNERVNLRGVSGQYVYAEGEDKILKISLNSGYVEEEVETVPWETSKSWQDETEPTALGEWVNDRLCVVHHYKVEWLSRVVAALVSQRVSADELMKGLKTRIWAVHCRSIVLNYLGGYEFRLENGEWLDTVNWLQQYYEAVLRDETEEELKEA